MWIENHMGDLLCIHLLRKVNHMSHIYIWYFCNILIVKLQVFEKKTNALKPLDTAHN